MAHDFPSMLQETQTIVVLGAHSEASRAAYYVPEHMYVHGYRIIPVNPKLAGTKVFDHTVLADLGAVDEPIDMLNVFRHSRHLEAHLPEILAMKYRPRIVWFQLGIRDDAVAAALEAEGIEVVQDRCLMVEHKHHG
jgi:hypothetical protein